MDDWGSIPGKGGEIYFLATASRLAVDRSPHLVPKLNVWSFNSILPYVFNVWCLGKHRGNFTLLKAHMWHATKLTFLINCALTPLELTLSLMKVGAFF
jgi:hypothetical protein